MSPRVAPDAAGEQKRQRADIMRELAAEVWVEKFRREFNREFGGQGVLPPVMTPADVLLGKRPRAPGQVPATSCAWRRVVKAADEARDRWLHRANRMEECGLRVVPYACKRRCPEGWHSRPDCCDQKTCPDCCSRIRRRNEKKVSKRIEGSKGALRFVTLTHRSGPALIPMIERLLGDFERLRHRAFWRKRVKGGVWVLEVTGHAGAWHAHLHVLTVGSWASLGFLPRPWLISEWQGASGCGCRRPRRLAQGDKPVLCCRSTWTDHRGEFAPCTDPACRCSGCPVEPRGQDVRAARGNAVGELCKYVAKDLGSRGGNLVDDPDSFKEFLLAIEGRRMLSFFGNLYDNGTDEDEEEGLPPCPSCGGERERLPLMTPEEFERARQGPFRERAGTRGPASEFQ